MKRLNEQITKMTPFLLLALLIVASLQLFDGVVSGQDSEDVVPSTMNYEGYVQDQLGLPLTGAYTMTFAIYADPVETVPLWSETLNGVQVQRGYFNVVLGNESPIVPALFDESSRYIGTTVSPFDEMVPRQRFGSVPFAIRTQHAVTADFALNIPNQEPAFDSSWFRMSSQNGVHSFKDIVHGLGVVPSRVEVLIRAINGPNKGYIFSPHGVAPRDDDDRGSYGGLVYAYNEQSVRLWAPTPAPGGAESGYIILIGDGWGNETAYYASHTADVRVLVWE